MSRIGVIAGAFALAGCLMAGCQTVGEVGGGGALVGQELDSALGLYGPYEEFLVLQGRPTYVWRRHHVAATQDYYCELRVETGFRRTISRAVMQGYPDACRLFSIRYVAARNN